jgi:hypothetical protein
LLPLPGVAYYLFIAVVLVWFEVTAVKLLRTISFPGSYREDRQRS